MSDEVSKIILGETAITSIERSSPSRRRFFGRRKKDRPQLSHCENCGTQLSGHYCSQCGQAAIDYRRSIWHVLVDVLNEFLNWDSKFFASIALLIAKPWRLTNEFLAGQRVRHVHPLRLYLLASIAFFFAATYWIKSMHFEPFNLSPKERTEIRHELDRENVAPEIREKIEQALGGQPISAKKRAVLEEQLKNEAIPEEARDRIRDRLEHGDLPPDARTKLEEAMKDLPPDARTTIEKSLTKTENKPVIFDSDDKDKHNGPGKWFERRAREKFGEHGTNIQLFVVTLVSNLPYMVLCCIPLFAFVLKILYLRKRIFYIDHLIYALHIHSFAYLAIMLIVGATLALNHFIPGAFAGWIIGLLWTIFAVQIFLSIRRVYRQGWFFSVFKFFLGGMVYLVVLLVALTTTFLITLASP